MQRTIGLWLLFAILLGAAPCSSSKVVAGEDMATVCFIPDLTVVHYTGEMFTVACVVENAYNLSGLSIRFSWNKTYLEYVSHFITFPVEDYPAPNPPSPYRGIIHAPPLLLRDDVNETGGIYWVAFATLGGAAFDGSGTVFVMTFVATTVPWGFEVEPLDYLDTYLHFEWVDLSHPGGWGDFWWTERDGVVRLLAAFTPHHDVAVTDILTSKTGCVPISTIGQGYPTNITATIENQGDFTETFNVTIHANTTTIDALQNVALAQNSELTHTLMWDTTGWAKGVYVVGATADTVPGEADTPDNTMSTVVMITVPGDVDGDHNVTIYDIVRMANVYDISQPDPEYDPNCDIDNDGDIDIYDIVIATDNYDEGW